MEPNCGPPGRAVGPTPADCNDYFPQNWLNNLLRVPLSLSILITAPLRKDLPLSPVAAFFVPLVESNVLFGSLVIAVLNFVISFMMKLQLVCPPAIRPAPKESAQITLTMAQLTQLLWAYSRGQPVDRFLQQPGDSFGPFGGDQPLFPDNLSAALMLSAPFADFDGSPDTSINVPLFEVPGMQGSLLVALLILMGRFIIEEGGLACPNPLDAKPLIDSQSMLRYIMSLKGTGR